MKFRFIFLSSIYLAMSFSVSVADASDLTGIYRIKGGCAYKTVTGDYNTCVAWNELKLTRTEKNEYAFGLMTNSFATTQGECGVIGTLQLMSERGRLYLAGSDSTLKMCHLRFEVTETSIVLNSPGFEQCAGACGLNASLESAPFPRKLAADHVPHCDDDHYYGPDFEMKCATKRYETADQRLNETYRRLTSKLSLRSRDQLRAEQRLWLKSLVANCEQATGAQQSITDVRQSEFRDCLAQESLRRTEELVRWGAANNDL
jgi:uncharacterized protein YecT (DUF1311 family)